MGNLWLINENRNDKLSYLRGLDLQELIIQIENFNFEYRQCLNLPNEITFGLEIEHEGIFRDKTNQFIKENIENWKLAYDLSLDDGGEIVSPILHDEIKTWQDLKKICESAKIFGELNMQEKFDTLSSVNSIGYRRIRKDRE